MKKVRILIRKLPILVLYFLVGCQDDSLVEVQQKEILQSESFYKVSNILKQDIQANKKLTTKMKSIIAIKYNEIGKSVYNTTYDFTINTRMAKFIESTNNNIHSYTFTIHRNNNTDGTIENLVFSYNTLTDDYNAGLVTYDLTASQKQEYLTSGQISSPFNISFSSLDINIDDVLNKSQTPCTITYQQFHQPHNSQNTHLHTLNGVVVNPCFHLGPEEEPCEIQVVIVIDCSGGGGGAASPPHDTSTPTPSGMGSDDYSNAGGSSNTNNNTAPNDGPEEVDTITLLMLGEETVKQLIIDCINDATSSTTEDITTIAPEILDQINLTINEWNDINILLHQNSCSEEVQTFVIEFLEIHLDTSEISFNLYQAILDFEQDYRSQMSEQELSIFNTLSTIEQIKYLWSAYDAVNKANELFSNPCELLNGKGDALRHAYWNALSTKRIGAALTYQLTTAHENRPISYLYHQKEKLMDLYNNEIGRNLGQLDASVIEQAVLDALNNGDLVYLNNLYSNCFATFTSELIPTNQ